MRDYLRSIPVFDESLEGFDPDTVPPDPQTLFASWLREAVEANVPEPHATVLSTVDESGRPDARVLILKDVDARAWWFSTSSTSPKGMQLAGRPEAALTFYWPAVARQVRIRGHVRVGSEEDSARDFLGRGPSGRAISIGSRQSERLDREEELVAAVHTAAERIAAEPSLIAEDWRTYAVDAVSVEFWQGDPSRLHLRLRYELDAMGWSHHRLWP